MSQNQIWFGKESKENRNRVQSAKTTWNETGDRRLFNVPETISIKTSQNGLGGVAGSSSLSKLNKIQTVVELEEMNESNNFRKNSYTGYLSNVVKIPSANGHKQNPQPHLWNNYPLRRRAGTAGAIRGSPRIVEEECLPESRPVSSKLNPLAVEGRKMEVNQNAPSFLNHPKSIIKTRPTTSIPSKPAPIHTNLEEISNAMTLRPVSGRKRPMTAAVGKIRPISAIAGHMEL